MRIAPISVSRRICAPAGIVWRLLINPHMWPHWGPSVSAVSMDEATLGPGTRGQVKVLGFIWLSFEVTRFDPGRYWAWRVNGIQATGHWVSAAGSQQCRLGFEIPWWAGPYTLICLMAIKRIQRLAEGDQP